MMLTTGGDDKIISSGLTALIMTIHRIAEYYHFDVSTITISDMLSLCWGRDRGYIEVSSLCYCMLTN